MRSGRMIQDDIFTYDDYRIEKKRDDEKLTSRTGPALSMVCSTPQPWLPFCDNAVKWCSRKLVDSVLPEPDSPIAFCFVFLMRDCKTRRETRNDKLVNNKGK